MIYSHFFITNAISVRIKMPKVIYFQGKKKSTRLKETRKDLLG